MPTMSQRPAAPLPPNSQPPCWFMSHWLDHHRWLWDAERRRFVIVLRNHVVQIIDRREIDWTWRVERMTGEGSGVVSVGIGFRTALEARRAVLAEFWSDLWDGRSAHEWWRHIHIQKPLVRRPEIIASRSQWAAEIETAVRAKGSG